MQRFSITLGDGWVVATGDRAVVAVDGSLRVFLGAGTTALVAAGAWAAFSLCAEAGAVEPDVPAPAERMAEGLALCPQCAAGDHSAHQAHLAGICVGCSCWSRPSGEGRGPAHAADGPGTPAFVETVEALAGGAA